MASRKTPQQRSIEMLRGMGWHCEVVEQIHRTPKCTFRRDLLGFADLIAFPTDANRQEFMLVQVTSASNHAARRTKIAAEPRVAYARNANATILIHSWRKNSSGDWVCRVEDVS